MFALKEYNEWIGLDLCSGLFYKIEISLDSNLEPYDSIEILEDSTESVISEFLFKKYNFLKFGGYKTIRKIDSSKKIF